MDKKWIIILAIVAIVVVIGVIFAALYFGTYNDLVSLEETANEKWAQVQQELQRRYDLIPNVIESAKLYIDYEGSILQNVTELRSQWASAMQSGNVGDVNEATTNLESGIANLIVVIENYPDLEASQVVQDLMIELEGTENRISTERGRYNEAVRDYNQVRRSFPANLWAGGWGFDAKDYFEATVGAEEVPSVS
ncbi:MAG: LemA family protein [Candidatus Bathyarchaeota archaeon]|nr:LemA family protein [Candidatus Bathyarchaeota archaeon]